MIRNLTLPVLAAATLLAASTADARGPGFRGAPPSAEEIETRLDERFSNLDTDGSDDVTLSEFMAHEGPERPRRRHRGEPDPEAMAEAQARLFELLDTDADGVVSVTEFEGLRAARKTVRKERMFDRLDANDDSVITRDELPNPAERRGGRWHGRG